MRIGVRKVPHMRLEVLHGCHRERRSERFERLLRHWQSLLWLRVLKRRLPAVVVRFSSG